jgi:hypothetical protein
MCNKSQDFYGLNSTLSPTAQAVLDAAFGPWQSTDTPASIAAAVLRATVQELKYFGITEKNILAIAAELEGDTKGR